MRRQKTRKVIHVLVGPARQLIDTVNRSTDFPDLNRNKPKLTTQPY